MITAIFVIQCDVCGDFLDRIQASLQPNADRNDWALHAGNLQGFASEEGWYFNSKTRKHWCSDCVLDIQRD